MSSCTRDSVLGDGWPVRLLCSRASNRALREHRCTPERSGARAAVTSDGRTGPVRQRVARKVSPESGVRRVRPHGGREAYLGFAQIRRLGQIGTVAGDGHPPRHMYTMASNACRYVSGPQLAGAAPSHSSDYDYDNDNDKARGRDYDPGGDGP